MIFPVWSNRHNAPGAEGATQRFAVIAFVQPQSFGVALALTEAAAIAGG